MNDTLIIIPTYNEKENVEGIAKAVFREVDDADILFVDDNSPDGTGALAEQMRAEDERVNVLHRTDKQGLGRAYIAGFQWALERQYEFIFEMDADFSHPPSAIPRMRQAADRADLVIGSRYIHGIRVINWPLSRLFLSKGAAIYVRLVTGMPITDPTGGFKCFRRRVLKDIELERIKSNGYSFQIEMNHQSWMRGFHVVEKPITFEERRSGESKMSSAIVREALWMVWKIAAKRGFRRKPRGSHPASIIHER